MVPETLKASGLFEIMRREKAHLACIIDAYGGFVGLVTLEDRPEVIVGEIADATDERNTEFPILPTQGAWNAHGLASLADVERVAGCSVEDSLDANTLSVLFMNRLERIP